MGSQSGSLQWAVWLLGSMLVFGCGPQLPEINQGSPAQASCPVPAAEGVQFAEDLRAADSWVVAVASPQLSAASVAPIWCGSITETYRVIVVPTRRPMVVITLQQGTSGWTAVVSTFQDPRPLQTREVPRLGEQHSVSVSNQNATQAVASVQRSGFWSAVVARHGPAEDGMGWILEARRGGKYWGVVRANSSDPLDDAVRRLIEAAGEPVPEGLSAKD